jgi:hypothetical protein
MNEHEQDYETGKELMHPFHHLFVWLLNHSFFESLGYPLLLQVVTVKTFLRKCKLRCFELLTRAKVYRELKKETRILPQRRGGLYCMLLPLVS